MGGTDTVPASKEESGNTVNKTPPAFTIDDLLAELRQIDVPDGVTIRELCERQGKPPTNSNMAAIRRKVRDLVALGLWEFVGKRRCQTPTGINWPTAAYRPREGGDANGTGESKVES